jgi:hypothetical protein
MNDHRSLISTLNSLTPHDLHWASTVVVILGAIVGVTSVDALDTVYATWTLAGGIVGTGISIAWRTHGETASIVVGRSLFALVGSIVGPPLVGHFFPSLNDLTRNPAMLLGEGVTAAIVSFLLGYAFFVVMQRRQNRISAAIMRRAFDDEEHLPVDKPE